MEGRFNVAYSCGGATRRRFSPDSRCSRQAGSQVKPSQRCDGKRLQRQPQLPPTPTTIVSYFNVSFLKEWVLEASEDDMELILEALHIQVSASRGEIQIEGSIPVLVPEGEDLVTIARTSGCLFNERLALNSIPMSYAFFDRPLYSRSVS